VTRKSGLFFFSFVVFDLTGLIMKLFTNNLSMNLFFAQMGKVCVGLFSKLDNDISVIFTFGTSHTKHSLQE